MRYINIDKTAIPYKVRIRIANRTYTFEFHYNAEGDFFAVDLSRSDEVLITGEKLVLDRSLFLNRDERFPRAVIVPMDLSGQSERVGWEELGNVKLYVFTEDDLDE